MSGSRLARGLAAALFSLASVVGAHAAPVAISGLGLCPDTGSPVTDDVVLCARGFGFNGPSFDTETGLPSGLGSVFESGAGATAEGSLFLSGGRGFASFNAFGNKSGTGSFGAADVSGRSSFEDELTITAPGLDGTAGVFRVALRVTALPALQIMLNGGTSQQVNANARWQADVVTNGTGWRFSASRSITENAVEGPNETLSGEDISGGVFVTGNLGFVFGTPFDLAAEFGMGIQAGSSGGVGTANATLGGSIRWLGFEAVETSGGAPVANFAVASASGTNYAAALPEPLGLISVAMLAAALRRGRRA